ncbi:MAG: hypothetical protein HY549_09940 [Elusimicrobia bacterium]|nr:hypothetical protein [Elusimicrobiota bacterium]
MRILDKIRSRDGQILGIVLVVMLLASIMVPIMVYYSQREAVWTAKQAASTTAFHLAEAGVEKGYLALTISTANWRSVQDGNELNNYHFDKIYEDVSGGSYVISITSGPASQQATILSIGKDIRNREVRSLQVVYTNAALSDIALLGGGGVNISGNNMNVEWGAIVSPSTITVGDKLHPTFWSAGALDKDTNGTTLPNCDSPNCWWWRSYYPDIPPQPTLDFTSYESSAIASGVGPCGAYHVNGNKSGSCNDTSGKPYYVTGNWTSFEGCVKSDIIVLGNLTTPNGALGGCAGTTATMPQTAWKQYSNDWSYYKTNFDAAAPAGFPGQYADYLSASNITETISPVVVGLLYVGGDFTGPTGGGNSDIVYGVMYVKGMVNLNSNSHCTIWYNKNTASAVQTSKIFLTRSSWRDVLRNWPL